MGLLLFLLMNSVLACEPKIEAAPEDVDGLAHWLWANYSDVEDETLSDAIDKLGVAFAFDELSEPKRGLLRNLTSADLASVEMEDRDPASAQGMYVANVFACDIEKMEGLLYALNQDELYPDVYTSYERRYSSELEAYTSRRVNSLSWEVDYEAKPMPAASYKAQSKGGVRYIAANEASEWRRGPALFQRTWMPQPAEYLDTDANEYDFDFQIELYFEISPGRMAHFYPLWRHMAFNGIGASTADGWIIDTILDGLEDWDKRSEELCAE